MKKLITNFLFQGLYQIVKILMPIITVPLVSHALGANNIGVYNFTQSITQYFILFGSLGRALYGQRSVAQVRDNKLKLSKVFWELQLLTLFTVGLSLAVFLIFASTSEYSAFLYVESMTIIAILFDVSWFFVGIEDFRTSSLRSIFVSLLTFVLIIIFVNGPEDVLLYVGIQSGGTLLSSIVIWAFIKDKIYFIKPDIKKLKKHFYQISKFFLSTAAIYLYTNLNKTMLGLLNSNSSVAFFSNAMIIVTVSTTLISVVDNVLLPNISHLQTKGDNNKIMSILNKSLNSQFFITLPMYFGIIAIREKWVPWFFGEEFLIINDLLPFLALIIVINPIGTSIARQYLIPTDQLTIYNKTVIRGAVIGIILNIILIPSLGVFGAVIASVISEVVVTFSRAVGFIKSENFKYNLKEIAVYLLCSIIMYIFIISITKSMDSNILTTLYQMIIGIIVYFSLTSLLKVNPMFELVKRKKKSREISGFN